MSKSGTESQSDVPEITVGLLSGVSSIVTKMLKVMEKVHYVQKDGTNSFQNYKYASEAAAIAALRPALVEVGLLLLPSVEKMWMDDNGNTHVELLYRIFDTSGDYIQFKAVGSGNDRNSKGIGDKGVYKALTGASKYALLKTFMMETGDDPEVPREEEKEDKKEVRKEIKKQPLQSVPTIAKKEVSDQERANYSLFVSQMIEWGETCSTEDELSEIWKSNQESIDKLKSPEVSDLYEKLKIQFTVFKAKAKGEV
jgi:hypothetical protein